MRLDQTIDRALAEDISRQKPSLGSGEPNAHHGIAGMIPEFYRNIS
jgi:hypothetical protein